MYQKKAIFFINFNFLFLSINRDGFLKYTVTTTQNISTIHYMNILNADF